MEHLVRTEVNFAQTRMPQAGAPGRKKFERPGRLAGLAYSPGESHPVLRQVPLSSSRLARTRGAASVLYPKSRCSVSALSLSPAWPPNLKETSVDCSEYRQLAWL